MGRQVWLGGPAGSFQPHSVSAGQKEASALVSGSRTRVGVREAGPADRIAYVLDPEDLKAAMEILRLGLIAYNS